MKDLAAKFDKNIRPLLDAVDKLRNLKVTNEGIPLPSIVVVGDQSSGNSSITFLGSAFSGFTRARSFGKSSVLESLATISLPRGQGIATRVPLVLRLQSCRVEEGTSIVISYKDVSSKITEAQIEASVDAATKVLAGTGKGVTDTPISLHIRKPGAPDLTMIDLPGITRVPVHGQPTNIYEQIAAMIKHYLKPKETVILNVLSATVDFSTCESIRMSQQEDKEGVRTLAVVTKVDRAPEGVYEKVTNDDVKIGLGYICVNRTDAENSHAKARQKERELFETHPSLSRLDKDYVGIGSLAERLTQIQADIIRRSLPEIHRQIEKTLLERRRELDALTQGLHGTDPTDAFLKVVDDNKSLLQDIMLHGRYDMFIDQNNMHFPPRLEEMFRTFNNKLHSVLQNILPDTKTKEILTQMAELQGLNLPNFLSPSLMNSLVREEIDKVTEFCTNLVPETHNYARVFVYGIIEQTTNLYPNLQAAYKQEVENVLSSSHERCMEFVKRILEKERATVFTMNDYYMANVKKLQDHVAKVVNSNDYAGNILLEGFGVPIDMREVYHQRSNDYQSAFTMKISLAAYWKVVHKRMADEIPQEIKFSLGNALLSNLRNAVLKAKMGKDLSALMEENASTLQKKLTLRKRVEVLKECKGVLQALF